MAQKKHPSSESHAPGCDQEITKKDCCEDNTLVVEASENMNFTSSVAAPDFHMVAVLSALIGFVFNASEETYDSFRDYSPPFIKRDIPVLVQSFLI